jgi:hypothetical protein
MPPTAPPAWAQIQIVGFEDAGRGERVPGCPLNWHYLSSNVSAWRAWRDARLDAESVVSGFELSATEKLRFREFRRLAALFWLEKLWPGPAASSLNTLEIACDQAQRVLALL